MVDETENVRRDRDVEQALTRWDTAQMQADFEVIGFAAPFVDVRRRADGIKGTLEFVHSPRFYFDFVPY